MPSKRLSRPAHPEACTCVGCVKARLKRWRRQPTRPARARGPEHSHKGRSSWWRSALMLMAITVGLWAVAWEPDALAAGGTASKLVTSGYDIVAKVVKGSNAQLTSGDIEAWVFKFTNDARVEAGLEPFQHDPAISTIARRHSKSMAVRGYGHIVDGKGPTDRAQDAEYDCGLGENIFEYPRLYSPWLGEDVPKKMARQLVDGWLDSPGHRANILDRNARKLGVGVYANGWAFTVLYATQNFASCR